MRAHRLLPGLVALLAIGCGDPNEPSPVNLRVRVSTVGVDQDSSYAVRTGDGSSHPFQTALSLFLSLGEHDVVLDQIAPNCSVEGAETVRVTIRSGEVASIAFEVACRAMTGAIAVTAPTVGRDTDPDGYQVYLDDVFVTRVFSSFPVVIESVPPGSHLVRLDDFSAHCRVNGPPEQTAVVTAGGLTRDTVYALFAGSCEAITGDVQIITATSGAERDRNGYTVTVNGNLLIEPCDFYDYYCDPDTPLMLLPTGSHVSSFLPPGDYAYRIGDIAPNCTVLDGDTRTVSVVPAETMTVRFDVTCEGP
jgi:hypothetical protein